MATTLRPSPPRLPQFPPIPTQIRPRHRGQADGILIQTPQDTQWFVIDAATDMQQAEALKKQGSTDKARESAGLLPTEQAGLPESKHRKGLQEPGKAEGATAPTGSS